VVLTVAWLVQPADRQSMSIRSLLHDARLCVQ
jgi:hypothetical protein